VLPTLAVILWAYGMYALFSFIVRRRSGQPRAQSRGRKLSTFALVGGLVGFGLILWCFSSDKKDNRLKLTGFLGTVYAEGWPDRVDRGDYPPVQAQNQGTGEKPAYALLHPETPTGQIEPEKKLIRPRPNAKKRQPASVNEKPGKTTKVTKTPAPSSKKDKVAAKSRAKKKKRSSTPENRQTNAG